jgi:hypothetical protein
MKYRTLLLLHTCRAVAFFLFAACDGEKRKRSEDTSHSGKGLRPPALPDHATALMGNITAYPASVVGDFL